ncbi:tigger transposable element-derived protein 1-like [Eleutherodactylus coqui]|uniref:tigger transposable element-derived protein 1-like n=1 Tax=Eleutherodactylus coqui TaxID=57060 RepID=UPI0034617BD4
MSGAKRKGSGDAGISKKRQAITMQTKADIIKRVERGEKMSDVARSYQMNRSTISTILKSKDRIMEHVRSSVPMHSTIISKKRGKVIEELENLLSIWMEDCHQKRKPLSLMLIQEKALSLFEDVKTKYGEEADVTFTASHGWFNRFKARNNLHNIKVTGEAASADTVAAQEFPATLKEIIQEGVFSPQQIFNVDETGLYWKKMPDRTYISKEEKSMPGFKPAKDRLTLLLGGNTAGDMKIKPLLVYHAENPRALKNIAKASLPVVWKSNRKAWVTLAMFQDWFYHHFIPEVERYCRDKNIPFNILLLLDNAPGHPTFLDDFHANVKVVFLPPNTTSLLQPMDQGAIATFKKYYLRRTFRQALKATEGESGMTLREFWKNFTIYNAIKNIDASWREIATATMNGVWKKLCPMFVHDAPSLAKLQAEEQNVVNNLVSISEKLDLHLEEQDFHEYFAVHNQELTNEDLMELENQRKKEEKEDELEVEPAPKHFQTKMMAKAFQMIEDSLELFESQDPNVERYTKVAASVHDALHCYRAIYDEKKAATTQASLDRFFRRMERCDESHHDTEPVPSTSGVTASTPTSSHPPSNVDVPLPLSADDSSSPIVDASVSPISAAPPSPNVSSSSSQ